MPKKGRPWSPDPHSEGNCDHDGRQEHDQPGSTYDVEYPLSSAAELALTYIRQFMKPPHKALIGPNDHNYTPACRPNGTEINNP
ncbi:hypothetical protein [Sinorhizobium fredii]|uniref:hypothetical protein n=1 Tax=Rhizobium fredii TaxID=380 RepID=UPI001F3CF42D|nr:hypothetical protein [Sinorhizobium fredii]